MSPNKEDDITLDAVIKSAMAEQALSLRRLSELCRLSPSTVSRILNQKQAANIKHLEAFSKHLQLPLSTLLRVSGWDVDEHANKNANECLNLMNDILDPYGVKIEDINDEIKKELKKYEHYANTAAGKEAIINGFLPKINEIKGEGAIIDQLNKLFQLYCADKTETQIRSIAGSALLYLILTPDVIPDYAFPLGYLDDAIAVVLTVKRLSDDYGVTHI